MVSCNYERQWECGIENKAFVFVFNFGANPQMISGHVLAELHSRCFVNFCRRELSCNVFDLDISTAD